MLMKILCVDTASLRLTVTCCGKYKTHTGGKANSHLLPLVDELLTELKIDVSELDGFCAVVGPGSFTGIRVGVSLVNALAYATGKQAVGVTSLEITGEHSALDAGNNNFYIKNGGDYSFGAVVPEGYILFDPDYSPEILQKLAMEKFLRGQAVSMLTPFYMRKSQAERQAEGD
jgi:tRNA A37 threonylcarbamoyladenosine modification protein TsaB